MGYGEMLGPDIIEPMIWSSIVAIEGQAARLAPVDTGNLRNSITIATNKRSAQHGPTAGMFGEGSRDMESPTEDGVGAVGTAVEYAGAVEFGRPDMPNYPAQPYLRPALDWFRSRVGLISGRELKVQMAAYRVRHPHKVREALSR